MSLDPNAYPCQEAQRVDWHLLASAGIKHMDMDNAASIKRWKVLSGIWAAVMVAAIVKSISIDDFLKNFPHGEAGLWVCVILVSTVLAFICLEISIIIDRKSCILCSARVPRNHCTKSTFTGEQKAWLCCVCIGKGGYPIGSKNIPPMDYCNSCGRKTCRVHLSLPHYPEDGLATQLDVNNVSESDILDLSRQAQIKNSALLMCRTCLEAWQLMNPHPSTIDRVQVG